MHETELDDAILSYIYDKLNFSEPVVGFDTIKAGAGYIVLSNHRNSKPKYVGWFKAITTQNPGDYWIYCGEYDGLHVYQVPDDYKPDSVVISRV